MDLCYCGIEAVEGGDLNAREYSDSAVRTERLNYTYEYLTGLKRS